MYFDWQIIYALKQLFPTLNYIFCRHRQNSPCVKYTYCSVIIRYPLNFCNLTLPWFIIILNRKHTVRAHTHLYRPRHTHTTTTHTQMCSPSRCAVQCSAAVQYCCRFLPLGCCCQQLTMQQGDSMLSSSPWRASSSWFTASRIGYSVSHHLMVVSSHLSEGDKSQ